MVYQTFQTIYCRKFRFCYPFKEYEFCYNGHVLGIIRVALFWYQAWYQVLLEWLYLGFALHFSALLSYGMQFLIPKPWPFQSFSEKLKLFINPLLPWLGSNSKFCLSYIGQLLKYLFSYFNLLAVIFCLGSSAHIRVNQELKGNLYTDFRALSLWFLHLGVSHSTQHSGSIKPTPQAGKTGFLLSSVCSMPSRPGNAPSEKPFKYWILSSVVPFIQDQHLSSL